MISSPSDEGEYVEGFDDTTITDANEDDEAPEVVTASRFGEAEAL